MDYNFNCRENKVFPLLKKIFFFITTNIHINHNYMKQVYGITALLNRINIIVRFVQNLENV